MTRDVFGLLRLPPLMTRCAGRPTLAIGLIDGPAAPDHPLLAPVVRTIGARDGTMKARRETRAGLAVRHGTFLAGILSAYRDRGAPALCPECRLLVRPIFEDLDREGLPDAAPDVLAGAIEECMEAGARILNLSLAAARPALHGHARLQAALDSACRRGVLVVAAAGNQGVIGSSTLLRHPWVIPVAACDLQARPIAYTNLSHGIGRRGVSAPGVEITSLAPDGGLARMGGTSVAAPLVTGMLALLWSLAPRASAHEIRAALVAPSRRPSRIVPPVADGVAASARLGIALPDLPDDSPEVAAC
ncbi:MAG TPA: S8 family serine peptidase [Paucimonas sp.]|nr:S8 family serine peptidase [Paucimonas sp.]